MQTPHQNSRWWFGPVLAAALACACTAVQAQVQDHPLSPIPGPGTTSSANGWDSDLGRPHEFEAKLQRAREKDRQKRIVDDANRLVEMTARYQKQVSSRKDPTPEDGKLLADIERLAREVKDRMRGN